LRNSIPLSTSGEPLATASAPASDHFRLLILAAPVFAVGLRVECLATIVAQPEPRRNVDRQSPFRSDKVAANARRADRKFLTEGCGG
jgi:hypothetical protein